MLRHNSLIRIKEAICAVCGNKKPIYAKKMCQGCYDLQAKQRYAKKYAESDDEPDEESVAILKKDADLLFSRLVRLRAAEPVTGMLNCYVCNEPVHYSIAHAMHFVAREDSAVRLHPKNVRAGCFCCNVTKSGNLAEYRKKLEAEEHRLPEWLEAEGREPYKFWRDELKRLIADWSMEINRLKKQKELK